MNKAGMHTSGDKSFAVLRIVFGMVWLIDASFKWNPAFISNFTNYVTQGAQNQPALVQAWINLWVRGVSIDPHFFAIVVAVAETALALSLLFGLLTELGIAGGIALMLVVWSTAEGFGGPYMPGSTDIGAAIIYVLVFVALWLGKSWRYYSIDSVLRKKIPFLYWHW
ncbi:MAG: DoxX family membrane protein [Patescibacteria group bacterium]|nr:DoxX family membrane protein [Patescibacteria group bacterium]